MVYLDNILIMAQCPWALSRQLQAAIDLMQGLGFVINGAKSSLVPSQKVVFLGFSIDTVETTLGLPGR